MLIEYRLIPRLLTNLEAKAFLRLFVMVALNLPNSLSRRILLNVLIAFFCSGVSSLVAFLIRFDSRYFTY